MTKQNSTIKNIIFDFGGVLMDWNPRYFYKDYFNDDEKMKYFLKHVAEDEWNAEQDRGRSLKDGTDIQVAKFPEWETEIRAYYDNWTTMLRSDIPENVAVLRQLKHSNYELFGLTNWSAETFPIALDRFEFFQVFDGILVSGKEKLIKPDEKIFERMMEKFHLKPESCLFIDDNLKNVEASRAFGIQTIHFINPEDLKEKLVEMKII